MAGREMFEQCGSEVPSVRFVLFFIGTALFVRYCCALSGGASSCGAFACSFAGDESVAREGVAFSDAILEDGAGDFRFSSAGVSC